VPIKELRLEILIRSVGPQERGAQVVYQIPSDGQAGLANSVTAQQEAKLIDRVKRLCALVDENDTTL
jgi:hypothetical protein